MGMVYKHVFPLKFNILLDSLFLIIENSLHLFPRLINILFIKFSIFLTVVSLRSCCLGCFGFGQSKPKYRRRQNMRQANRFRVRFWHRRRVSVFGIGHGNIGGWVRAKEEAWVFGLVYTQNVREKFARFFIAIVYGGISNIQHCIAVAVDGTAVLLLRLLLLLLLLGCQWQHQTKPDPKQLGMGNVTYIFATFICIFFCGNRLFLPASIVGDSQVWMIAVTQVKPLLQLLLRKLEFLMVAVS